ncbi:AbrB/MazE/SpoVT family DNA-binding domain-containing protein [Candidatus Woesearchaeota archaeon]|nr:AbrB/MazE/SpoVT family DNA-binding domain-containing protein [Candidatus Woesearchaeota archaeon]
MHSAGTYKITRQCQITLPYEIREQLKLKEGDNLDFFYNNSLILIKKKKSPKDLFEEIAERTRERFKQKNITEKMIQKIIKEVRYDKNSS